MLSERVATHFTGRRIWRDAHSTSASSGKMFFNPKPPPTSGDTTRIWVSGTWKTCDISMRAPCGFWLVA